MTKSKTTKTNYSKEDFLSILSTLSIKEINNIIKEKGKESKLITPFIILKDGKKLN